MIERRGHRRSDFFLERVKGKDARAERGKVGSVWCRIGRVEGIDIESPMFRPGRPRDRSGLGCDAKVPASRDTTSDRRLNDRETDLTLVQGCIEQKIEQIGVLKVKRREEKE